MLALCSLSRDLEVHALQRSDQNLRSVAAQPTEWTVAVLFLQHTARSSWAAGKRPRLGATAIASSSAQRVMEAAKMKKLLLFAIVAAGLYLAWIRFAPSRAPSPASSGDATPAANTQQRIDALSGAAPAE